MANNAIFESIPVEKVKWSKFDRSHEVKISTKLGKLVPVLCKQVTPGTKVRLTSEMFLRTQPQVFPTMHRIEANIHHFFVPMDVITRGQGLQNVWERFITGGRDGNLNTPLPTFTMENLRANKVALGITDEDSFQRAFGPSSHWTALGMPSLPSVGIANYAAFNALGANSLSTQPLSLLPFAAAGRVLLDYFMDENYVLSTYDEESSEDLQPSLHEGPYSGAVAADANWLRSWVVNSAGDGDNPYDIWVRGYEKDYFTSALPWPQRGDAVLIPMEMTVAYKDISDVLRSDGTPVGGDFLMGTNTGGGGQLDVEKPGAALPGAYGRIENIESISNVSFTFADFRTAAVAQQYLENNARSGFKYKEQTFVRYNFTIPDYTLEASYYIGGQKANIVVEDVPATATSEDAESAILPQGNLAGKGTAYLPGKSVYYECPNHGYVISFLSTRVRTAYFQGLDRMFSDTDVFDVITPEFANLGEQPVYSNELYWDITGDNNDAIFGYQPRYSNHKYAPDRVIGDFQTSLVNYHLARVFDNTARGIQNSLSFINQDPDELARIFAVTTGDNLLGSIYHNIDMILPLPYYSVPGIRKV